VVECNLAKVEVASSNLVSRSKKNTEESLMGSSFFIPSLTKTFTNLHGILLNPHHLVAIHFKQHLIPVPHQADQSEHINLKKAVETRRHGKHRGIKRF
jgi:hypothetical protein